MLGSNILELPFATLSMEVIREPVLLPNVSVIQAIRSSNVKNPLADVSLSAGTGSNFSTMAMSWNSFSDDSDFSDPTVLSNSPYHVLRLFKDRSLVLQIAVPESDLKTKLCRWVYAFQKDIDRDLVGTQTQPLFSGVPYGLNQPPRPEFVPVSIAVVGSSGSGKSTFLQSVSSDYPEYMSFEGHMSFRTRQSDIRNFFQKPRRLGRPIETPFVLMPLAVDETMFNVTLWDTYGAALILNFSD
jgi:hypothetical protein